MKNKTRANSEQIMTINWQWRSFDALQSNEIYDMLAIRQEVFVLEQKCAYQDLDYLDQKSLHLFGKKDNQLIGYLRLLPINIPYEGAISFGRVLTPTPARNQGFGKLLIQEVLDYLKKENCKSPIIISAQAYLKNFYEKFGFQTISQPYDDVGIIHIKMKKSYDNA